MTKLKKIIISALVLGLCTQSYSYANDAINIMNAVMKTLSTNPPQTKPKPVYTQTGTSTQGSSAGSGASTTAGSPSSSTGTTAPANTQAPNVQNAPAQQPVSGTVMSRYKEMTSAVWEAYDASMSPLDMTALLSSQNDGVVTNFDTPMEEIKGRTVLPWYNGNYIVWNTGMGDEGIFYSQEFDNNKFEKAFVVIVKPDSYDKYFRVYEYMKSQQFDIPLTTAFIYDPEFDEAYLFDANKNLLASKYGQTVKNLKPEVVKNLDFINQITAVFYKNRK